MWACRCGCWTALPGMADISTPPHLYNIIAIMYYGFPTIPLFTLPCCRSESRRIFRHVFMLSIRFHITRHSSFKLILPCKNSPAASLPSIPLPLSSVPSTHFFSLDSPSICFFSATIPMLSIHSLSFWHFAVFSVVFLFFYSSSAFLSTSPAFIFPVPCHSS